MQPLLLQKHGIKTSNSMWVKTQVQINSHVTPKWLMVLKMWNQHEKVQRVVLNKIIKNQIQDFKKHHRTRMPNETHLLEPC